MVALQIRDVPDQVRDALTRTASERGQSLQAYLLDLVTREARFRRNADIFHATIDLRIDLPSSGEPGSPEKVVREGRDSGFAVDRP